MKPVQTGRFRFGFLGQKPVQTGLAWFFRFCLILARFFRFDSIFQVWLGFFFFWVRFGSVRFFWFQAYKTEIEPNWSIFFKILISLISFFFIIWFFQLCFFSFFNFLVFFSPRDGPIKVFHSVLSSLSSVQLKKVEMKNIFSETSQFFLLVFIFHLSYFF